jgi:hypothetical protein
MIKYAGIECEKFPVNWKQEEPVGLANQKQENSDQM